MPKFGFRSRSNLETCSHQLQLIFERVIVDFDCSVLCGTRNEADQNAASDAGRSTKRFPNSKHNSSPSRAVDVAPWPIDWSDIPRFRYFAGFVMGIASSMRFELRWGGDWDRDTDLRDQNFNDLVHFELVE